MQTDAAERTDYRRDTRSHYRSSSVARNYYVAHKGRAAPGRLRSVLVAWGERRAVRRALASLVSPGSLLLDIPCGTGKITDLLLRQQFRVVGADVSLEMMAFARRDLGNNKALLGLQQADLEALSYRDEIFDCTTCIRLFHRIPGTVRERMLREMRRVSRRYIVVSYGFVTPFLRLRRAIRKLIIRRPLLRHPVTPDQLREEAERAGLTIVRTLSVLGPLSEERVVVYEISRKRMEADDLNL